MTFGESFRDVCDWAVENYPSLKGYRVRSFAWEYDLSTLKYELANIATQAMEDRDEIVASDFDDVVERVIPPEGFAYVTFQKGNVRVGINVPCGVFQKEPAALAKPANGGGK